MSTYVIRAPQAKKMVLLKTKIAQTVGTLPAVGG